MYDVFRIMVPFKQLNLEVQPLLVSCWGVYAWGAVGLPGLHFFVVSIAPCVPWVFLTTLDASMVIGALVTLAPCALCVKVKAVDLRDWWVYPFAVPKGHALTPSPTVGFSLEVGPKYEPWANGYTHAPAGTEHHKNSSPQPPYSEVPNPWWPEHSWHKRGAPGCHQVVSGCKPQ